MQKLLIMFNSPAKSLIFISLLIMFLTGCGQNSIEKLELKEKPLQKLTEDQIVHLYTDFTSNPSNQWQKDINSLIDYAIDNNILFSKTETGLMYKFLRKGMGMNAKFGQAVKVNYQGSFVDKKVFDSSYKRGESYQMIIGEGIYAWDEALEMMNPGSKIIILVPSQLAYGEEGFPGFVPPNTPLVFTIELL
jgi:FKBP-type peptidyl-prolyl cis-trans isomerase